MSYFATIAGIDLSGRLPRGRLIPLSESQYYTQDLAPYIEGEDGTPAFLWDDNETDTSHEIICDAETEIQSGASPEHTDLGKALLVCSEFGATLRVWWAGRPDAEKKLESLEHIEHVLILAAEQALTESIGFIFKPSKMKAPPNKMQTLDLHALLGDKYEHATFHDSELESIAIDFPTNSITLGFSIPCGFLPGSELLYRSGSLQFQDICFYALEPSAYSRGANDRPALWITSDGPLPDSEVEVSSKLPEDLPQDAFAHYFYASTTNSFIVVAARRAAFQWQ